MVPQMTLAQIRKLTGDPNKIDRDLEEFHKSAKVLSFEWARLIDEYPQQWVGVYQSIVKAHADTLPELLQELDKQGIPRSSTAVGYMDRVVETMIL